MKLVQIRKYRKKTSLLPKMISDNPLLILALDLPFIVVASNTLKNAAAFSIEMLFIHLSTMLVGWFIVKKLKIWQSFFVTSFISTAAMLISRQLVLYIFPNIDNSAGMYLYLMAFNGVTVAQANFLSPTARLNNVVKTAFLNIALFSLVVSLVSLIREYFGTGTIWGIQVPVPVKLDGIRAPFFGFILLGILLAIGNYINRQFIGFQILENVRMNRFASIEKKENNR